MCYLRSLALDMQSMHSILAKGVMVTEDRLYADPTVPKQHLRVNKYNPPDISILCCIQVAFSVPLQSGLLSTLGLWIGMGWGEIMTLTLLDFLSSIWDRKGLHLACLARYPSLTQKKSKWVLYDKQAIAKDLTPPEVGAFMLGDRSMVTKWPRVTLRLTKLVLMLRLKWLVFEGPSFMNVKCRCTT